MLKKKQTKEMSIARKMLQFMLLLVLAQGILFVATLIFNGGFRTLREQSCSDFNSAVQERGSSMANLMNNSWSNLSLYSDYLTEIVQKKLDQENVTLETLRDDKRFNNRVLQESVSVLVGMLRSNSVNEVYLILNGYGDVQQSSRRCGILIRDLDLTVNAGYEDLLLEVGANSISRGLGIAMDRYWTATFDLTGDSIDAAYYWNPYYAAVENPDASLENLGYWSPLYQWNSADMEVLSYSIPLIMDGEVYGVLGITVSENQLETLMSYNELAEGRGCYILAETDQNAKEYTPILIAGITGLTGISEDATVRLGDSVYVDHVYEMEGADNYVSVYSLGLYDHTSVNNNHKWVLLGVESQDELLSTSENVYEAVFLSLALAVLVSFFLASWGSVQLARPITEMDRIVRGIDNRKRLSFPHTNIREVDELQKAILVLDKNVRESASKLSGIVELVGMPLGAVEYRSDEKKVFCTRQIVSLLHLDEDRYQEQYIDRDYFEQYMRDHKLDDVLLFETEKRCCLGDDTQEHWLLFKSKVEDEKVLIVVTDITEETMEKQRIEYERDYDGLTHLLNRRAFRRKITNMLMEKTTEDLGICAMVMWDLDNLKYINDSYGHDYGDRYIQEAADVFRREAGEKAYVGRLSGDEFLAFFFHCQGKDELMRQINTIRERLNATKVIMSDGEKIAIRASGGVAWYPDDGKTYDELKRYADYAMYDTKSSYKGTVKEFNRRAYEQDYLLLNGKEQLNRLIDQQAVKYVFQPIVSACDGTVWGYEALMRPCIEGMKTPGDVMRLARNQARLADIEVMTFQVISRYYEKMQEDFRGKKIFINSIPDQILSHDTEKQLIWSRENLWEDVVVEILESEQADIQTIQEKKARIQTLGAQIALDDFGVGYSSEVSLLYMKPHYVKIDIAFCRDIASDKNRQMLVKNLVRYAVPRGVRTLAEGIETLEDMETLIGLGVDLLQGFYLGDPEPELRDISLKVRQEIIQATKYHI